jgi:hypothetical protein
MWDTIIKQDLSVKISPVVSDDISKVDILFLDTMVMFEGWLTCRTLFYSGDQIRIFPAKFG